MVKYKKVEKALIKLNLAWHEKDFLLLEQKWNINTVDYLIVEKNERSSARIIINTTIPNKAYIADFYVNEHIRKRGFGHKLMQEVLDTCKTCRLKTLYLQVNRKNEDAIRFYKSFGFKEMEVDSLNRLSCPAEYDDYLSMICTIK